MTENHERQVEKWGENKKIIAKPIGNEGLSKRKTNMDKRTEFETQ